MLPTLDYRDYIVTIIVILFLLSFFINTYQYQKNVRIRKTVMQAVNMLSIYFLALSAFSSQPIFFIPNRLKLTLSQLKPSKQVIIKQFIKTTKLSTSISKMQMTMASHYLDFPNWSPFQPKTSIPKHPLPKILSSPKTVPKVIVNV